MARRKRGGRRRGKDWIQTAFNILGGVIAAGPAIDATVANINTPQNIPVGVLFNYTGYYAPTGGFDKNKLIGGVASMVGGGVVAAVPKIYRKVKAMFR